MGSSPNVPVFDRHFFDGQEDFTRIGHGSLGGKAQGLWLVREQILSKLDLASFPEVTVTVPRLCVITTDLFDAFIRQNHLDEAGSSDMPDDRLAVLFQQASLPAELLGDLRALITKLHVPLAVRSSSLLEDALHHPFAGVYATKMIPNNQHDPDQRYRKLTEAIKFIYASTFFSEAKSYRQSIQADPGSEKMAVILQEIVGSRNGDRFYPSLSGVARSFNYYPTGHARPKDGVVNLALGLGKTIVDGGLSWTYSPAFPKSPPPYNSIGDLIKNTQTDFWAVNMGPAPAHDPIHETEYLVKAGLQDGEKDGSLRFVASTYDGSADRIYPGVGPSGPRVLNFAPILSFGQIPLNPLLKTLLQLSEAALGADVEVEFALTLDPLHGLPMRLGYLQVRPMAISNEVVEVCLEDLKRPEVVVASSNVLGNGQREDIHDLVFLKPEVFSAQATPQMALELERINRPLADARKPCVLIGFGRWGSSDPWLGVPVNWAQISSAKAIVEATLPQMNPDLSQGSHFFHNLIGFHVLYLSVPHDGEHAIDWGWLNQLPVVTETDFVKHVRADSPVRIRVDGRTGRGVICRHERSE